MTSIKQVILIRRDLKMRRGKEIAQGSHASMDFLVEPLRDLLRANESNLQIDLSEDEKTWLLFGMAKICLQVGSEAELLEFHKKALDAGLKSHLIRDSGRTEFNGEPTFTACAIGPAAADKIDIITSSLSLY
jgi:PTH2 family peptidyl-tRNA hydrolase